MTSAVLFFVLAAWLNIILFIGLFLDQIGIRAVAYAGYHNIKEYVVNKDKS